MNQVRQTLIGHINRDYSSFVSLSSLLSNLDNDIKECRIPLLEAIQQLEEAEEIINESSVAIRGKFAELANIKKQKLVIERLLDLNCLINGLELLLDNGTVEQEVKKKKKDMKMIRKYGYIK